MEWIVVASGLHTLYLKLVMSRFPGAKVVGPTQAQAKLNVIAGGKLDYDSTNAADLAAANSLLLPEGIQLFDVAGDVYTNVLVAVFEEERLMSCDLLYTHADGEGYLDIDKERFNEFLPEEFSKRLFRFTNFAVPNSPAGFLPVYRYQFMDPNSMGIGAYNQPAWDGSSCKLMATSLRKIIKAPFKLAYGVHFNEMDRDDYVHGLDKNWNWLDGKPLI